jgi:hypothetical protein
MAEKDDKAELIDDGKVVEKIPEKKEEPKRTSPSGAHLTASGLTEDRNEPHIHMAILIVIVTILGVIIAFWKF